MAKHISTIQVLNHIKTATYAGIDKDKYDITSVTDSEIIIGPYTFPISKFDAGGMNRQTLALVDSTEQFREITLLDSDGNAIAHPDWETEDYDVRRVRNMHLLTAVNDNIGKPLSIYMASEPVAITKSKNL